MLHVHFDTTRAACRHAQKEEQWFFSLVVCLLSSSISAMAQNPVATDTVTFLPATGLSTSPALLFPPARGRRSGFFDGCSACFLPPSSSIAAMVQNPVASDPLAFLPATGLITSSATGLGLDNFFRHRAQPVWLLSTPMAGDSRQTTQRNRQSPKSGRGGRRQSVDLG